MLKHLLDEEEEGQGGEGEREGEEEIKNVNNKKAINTYLSTITLKTNGLNTLIIRQMVVNGQQNKTLTYAVYRKLTLDQKIHID